MKDAINYNLLKDLLIAHYIKVIDEFAKSNGNKDVYVLALVVNGDISMHWNTLSELHYRYQDAYQGIYQERYSIDDIRFSIGDFSFEEMLEWPKEMDELVTTQMNFTMEMDNDSDEVYEYNCKRLIECLIEVMKELKPAFSHLNKTDDFVAFVSDFGDPDHFRYAHETVSSELYLKVFGN